jgi:hypothetical protein
MQTLTVWKTIKIGIYKNAGEYHKVLKSAGYGIAPWAKDVLTNGIFGKAKFACAKQVSDIDLVVVSVADLGFKEMVHHNQICERALELGLELCPPEVGPALRLSYKDQPNKEALIVGMKPIKGSDDRSMVFILEHSENMLWLHGNTVGRDSWRHFDLRFVFVQP